jgi:VWFA-related protein
VTIDVSVTDKRDNPVQGLEKNNFRVFEDGVERPVTQIRKTDRKLALVFVVDLGEGFAYDLPNSLEPASGLVQLLQAPDWGALVSFDYQPLIVTDFTRDTRKLLSGLRGLKTSGQRDAALYDAVYFVLDRMAGMDERGVIVLLASGRDGLSRNRSYAETLRRAESSDVMIYSVRFTRPLSPLAAPHPNQIEDYSNREGEFTLALLSEATGGMSFTPGTPGQYSTIAAAVNTDVRNQYRLSFVPSDSGSTGKLRKLRVEVSGTDLDHNGKPDKLQVRHKRGYWPSS